MAKMRPGGLMGQLSGKVGNVVFAHNRFGSYVRSLVIPTKPATDKQALQRACFAGASTVWKSLTEAQQLSWKEWAGQNPIINNIGVSQILDGHAAFVQLNARLAASGDAAILEPPIIPAPVAVQADAFTYDLGTDGVSIALAAALPAGCKMCMYAFVANSPKINFVGTRFRLVDRLTISSSTAVKFGPAVEAVFGALVEGQTLHLKFAVYDTATGLYSTFQTASGVIIDTP